MLSALYHPQLSDCRRLFLRNYEVLINIGVNVGLLPTKGLTLPLMSFGGSAIVMNMVALAVVLRIDIENRQLMRGGRA